ncbi:MAG: hypothetical protein MZV70_12270 [Desulfobacterales bacterium]|nr:hypothetical protein [Desulfobacterales bacterium]
MIKTAENVAKEEGITRKECDEVALHRYKQYQDALANDREFQKRYMYPVDDQGLQEADPHARCGRGRHGDHGRGAGRSPAGAAGRRPHLRRPDPPGRRPLRDHRRRHANRPSR